jgi:hypothetical protein
VPWAIVVLKPISTILPRLRVDGKAGDLRRLTTSLVRSFLVQETAA